MEFQRASWLRGPYAPVLDSMRRAAAEIWEQARHTGSQAAWGCLLENAIGFTSDELWVIRSLCLAAF